MSESWLTPESILKTIQAVEEADRRPHQHVVHPEALKTDGWYMCDCGPLYIVGGRISAPPSEHFGPVGSCFRTRDNTMSVCLSCDSPGVERDLVWREAGSPPIRVVVCLCDVHYVEALTMNEATP